MALGERATLESSLVMPALKASIRSIERASSPAEMKWPVRSVASTPYT